MAVVRMAVCRMAVVRYGSCPRAASTSRRNRTHGLRKNKYKEI